MHNLSNIWSPSNCLSKSQLEGYIRQTLDRDEVYLVESHLNDCMICSDALDGLMEADLNQTQSHVAEIKSNIEEKIKLNYAPSNIEPAVQKTIKTNKHIETPLRSHTSHSKTRWLVAACILAIIFIGGYSVYSLIKNKEPQLAQNTSNKNVHEADYHKTNDSNANEMNSIAMRNDTDLRSKKIASTQKTNEPIKHVASIPSDETVGARSLSSSEEQAKAPPAVAREETSMLKENKKSPTTKDYFEESEKNLKSKSAAPLTDTTRPVNVAKQEALFKNRSTYGMSNHSLNAPAQNAPQLSYSSQSERNTQQNAASSQERADKQNDDNEIALSDYEQGMAYYQQGAYKKSITYLKRALKNAEGTHKEDIQYQLAQAYLGEGKTQQADSIFRILLNGTKYTKEANAHLINVRK